jgi:predicted alpha-1,2-mannosidase
MQRFWFQLVVILIFCSCEQKPTGENGLTQFVNPFIGTDGPGNTYPGATVPFGMVQLSPDIGTPGWDRIAGYYYQDTIISGFSHTHLTGTGAGDMYDVLVMPTNSKFSDRIEANGYRPFSRYSHEYETASLGYYQVKLLDYNINAEVTATKRVGIHKYTFPKDTNSKIYIDLGYSLNWDAPTDTYIEQVNETTLRGYRMSTGWAKDQRLYFEMQFSKPFKTIVAYQDTVKASLPVQSKNTKVIVSYSTNDNEEIIIKTGVSTASLEGASLSIQKEAPHFNFETYKEQAKQTWEHQLKKIKIATEDVDKKTIFYTMMYQSMLAPTLLSDYNNEYKGANHKTMQTNGFTRFDTFSLWDTFRAAHPLYTIIQPEFVPHFIASMLAHYNETGTLPVWSMQGNETNMMIGYHAVPVIVDAYFKGFNFDAELAYNACKNSAMVSERQIDVYMEKGYIPVDEAHENWSVSKTLEYAYDDWCIAMFAKALNKEEDYAYFIQRSENWKNLYNNNNTWLQPKDTLGNFIEPFIPKDYTPYYCESNAWHYYWFVPQNVQGLIEKTGGNTRFEQKLDSMFTYAPSADDKLPIFSTGMIGQYAHGNEPSHHVAYLYNYINKPHKAQERIREILETQYKNQPNGHCGNEDCGQMSSWYIFNALGFYPVNPANGVYNLGIPLFKEAKIRISDGKEFTILAQNFNSKNNYVERVLLNEKELNRNFITHKEVLQGGTLTFIMTNTPSNNNLQSPNPSKVYN